MDEVTVYTTPSCHFCKEVKAWLADHGIAYQELNVAADEERRHELFALTGRMAVPVLKTGDGEIVMGYDPDRLELLFA